MKIDELSKNLEKIENRLKIETRNKKYRDDTFEIDNKKLVTLLKGVEEITKLNKFVK